MKKKKKQALTFDNNKRKEESDMLSCCYRGCCFGLTWCQDSYGGEESLFLLHHMELTDAFVEVEHGCHEFL